MIRFLEPNFLYLLLLLLPMWWFGRRLRGMAPGRKFSILLIRSLLIIMLVLALARPEFNRKATDMAVFYLLDRSDSIPLKSQEEQLLLLDKLSKRATKVDATGVIAFGEKPSMETSPARLYSFEGRLLSTVAGERSDISAAVRLALAAFPADTMRRIVLLTDGNENLGSSLEVARLASNSGIPIDIIPQRYEMGRDVQVEKLVIPPSTTRDAPFDLKVFLSSRQAGDGRLRIYRDGELIVEQDVELEEGRNPPLILSQRLLDGGFHTYTATVDVAGDSRPQNNKATAFTYLKGEPRVLLVDGSPDPEASVRFLAAALATENIATDIRSTLAIPVQLDELQKYDSIIFSNVPADALSLAQMEMIERAVHDLGIGFVMVGGERAFGAGGYMDTPIEKVLPVSMDVKQKKVLPNGALVILLHTCEIPDGNAWARQIALASLNVLSARDYFGIIYLGMQGSGGWQDEWAWSPAIQMTENKRMMRNAIRGITPLDMLTFDTSLDMASKELVKIKAETKHIVVISDGDPAPPSQAVVNRIRNDGITVSAIAIAPHNGQSVETLEQMAYWGAGNFYYPKTGAELPRIFTKEASVVRKSLIREEEFLPLSDAPSEVLVGFAGLPPLYGYVVTSIKDLATQALATPWEDPLLAHWRYGLGKSVAFTSDARDKWGSQWVQWGSYAKFWAQIVRWSLRETNSGNYQINTDLANGVGRVTIDALDEAGNFQNFIDFKGAVVGPDFKPVDLSIRQVAPGRYEGTFPAAQVGSYMVSLNTDEENKAPEFLTTGLSLSYSPEYETSRSADEFLSRIATATGGKMVEELEGYNPYDRNLDPARRPQPLWPWFLFIGILLVPVDVFLRRVYLDWNDAKEWLLKKFARPTANEGTAEAQLESLRAAKSRATKDQKEEASEQAARDEFRKRLAAQSESQQAAPPGPRQTGGPKPSVATQPPTSGTPTDDPAKGGMESLLEAKKRAQQKRRPHDQ